MIVNSALKYCYVPVSQCVSVTLMSILISRYEAIISTLILCRGIFLFSFQLAVFAQDMKVSRSKASVNDNKGIKAAGCRSLEIKS